MSYYRESLREHPRNFPSHLYRVQNVNCATIYSNGDLLAAEIDDTFQSDAEFIQSIQKTLDWNNRSPTPWINVFSDRRHAVNFALSRENATRLPHYLLTIESSKLQHTYL